VSAHSEDDQAARIRRKLVDVPLTRERRAVYGEDWHRWEVRPPVPEDDLIAFERRNGIRLPSSYRRYLREVGGGGAGPGNEIYPLSRHADRLVGLDHPYVLDADADYDVGDWSWRRLLHDSQADGDDLDSPVVEAGQDSVYPFYGMLPVSNRGCSFEDMLVITGAARGRIALVDHDMNGPPRFYPEATFLDWYEAWLDRIIARCATDEELLDEARVHQLSGVRLGALTDLGRRPDLAPALLAAVADLAVSDRVRGRERQEAVRVLGQHGVLTWPLPAMARPLRTDPDEWMRGVLVEVLGQSADWGLDHPAVAVFAADESWHVHWKLLQSLRRWTSSREDKVAAKMSALRAELGG
jgi:SMI1 / KNR4 family (SUKH-1)